MAKKINLTKEQIEAAAKAGREKTEKAYAQKAQAIAKGYGTNSAKSKVGKNRGQLPGVSEVLARNNPAFAALQQAGSAKKLTKGSDAISYGKKSSERKPGQISALGAGDYGASKTTRFDATANAAIYSTAGAFSNLFGLLKEKDAQTKARDAADSARLKAGYDAMLNGEDINTREGGLKKQHEDSQKAFERGYAALAGAGQKNFDTADELAARSNEYQQIAKEGLGKFGQVVVDFGIAGLQFAGDAAMNAILPGSGLAAMGMRAAGSGAQEARNNGLDINDQLTTGLKSAAIEVLTKKLFGAASKVAYGKGIIKNESLVNGLVNRLAKTDKGRTALKVIVGANEEGLEEVLSDILNPVADRVLKLDDGKGDWSDLGEDMDAEQMLEDYIIGSTLGLFGAGTNVISGQYRAENAQQRAYENYQRELVNAGLASEQGSQAQLTAAEYQNILDNSAKRGNRNLSDKETANLEQLITAERDTPAVRNALERSGTLVDDNTATVIAKAASGQKLTRAEQSIIDSSPVMQQAVNTMTGSGAVANIRTMAAKNSVVNSMAERYTVSPEVISRTYDLAPVESPEAFEMAFDAVYQMGQQGANKESLIKVPVLNRAQAEIAYNMGASTTQAAVDNATVQGDNVSTQVNNQINTQEVNNNGVRLRDSGQRLNGQNTEGQIPSVERGAVEAYAGTDSGRQSGYSAAQGKTGQKVVYNGVEQENVYYSGEDTESMKKGRELARSYGYNVTYFEGGNIKDSGGEFRGMVDTESKTVMVRSDHPDISAEQIMRHEMGHAAIAQGDISLDELRSAMLSDLSEKELSSAVEVYRHAYGDTISEAEAFEEMCCDALGKINIFAGTEHDSANYGKVQESFRKHTAETANKGRASPKSGVNGKKHSNDAGSFGRSTDAYIALHPEQIKSATDNIGAFDESNPDIRYSREPESITELRRQNETMLAQATNEDAANENERGLIKDYKRQYDKVSGIAEKLDAARQEVLTAESSGDKNAIATARNRFTLLSRKYAEEHRKLSDYVNIKALDNVLTRVKDRTAENSLPEGMGAASAEFTGEETRGERWVTEAQGKGNNALHPISREQEANLAEQQHRAPQEIPKEDLNGKLTSKHVSTLANSGVTPAEFSDALREDAAQGKFSHIAYSDEAALKKAEITIEANGWEQALADYKAQINAGKVSKDNTVMGIALYNNAVNSGDYATALDIASLMVKNSTNTAQSLQAMRILNKLSPECKLYLAAKSVETIEEDLNEKYKDNKADIHVDKVLYDEYGKALRSGDEDGIKTAWAKIEQSVAQQIDATWYEKLNNFRYLAMLGNPRTHVRNIVGNAFFVPVRAVKNTIAYGLENVADSKVNGGIERSKAMLNRNNANDVALIKYAMTDYEAMQETILSGGKYVDTFQGIDKKRTIYKTKILEAARKGNSNLLDAEDAWFCKPAYANALAKWYKANGITAEQLNTGKVPESTIIKAQTVAVKEAQKATYRDTNRFSAMVSRLGEVDNKIASALIEGVLPFKKTPANILVRAVEYSPVGLIKSLAVDTKKVKAYVNGDVENGMSPAQFIDDVSAGLTGTALVGLGILLASWGLFSGSPGDDDKQNKFDELGGSQNYALNIGGLSITLDWLAPESMPLFVGVELYNSLSGKSEDNGFVQNLMSSVMSLSTPMFEMSMLQSVNDLFDNLAYIKQGQGSFKIVTSMATNYISQYFPTLFGQAERAFGENQRETTYIDRNSNVGSELQYMWGKIANKIPLYDFSQIPYIDAWGRTEETGNLFERVLNNFVNPAYVKKERSTEIDGELKRLYDLGETSVYPSRAKTNTKINGEYLTAEEYVKYATVKGQTSYDLATKIINSSAYSRASDAEKAYMLSYVYKYADHIAKYEVNNESSLAKWEAAAYKSSNPAQGIIDHAQEYYKRKENDES